MDQNVAGRSLVPIFKGEKTELSDRAIFWEHQGNRAIRQGDWKLVAQEGGPWELYQMSVDRSEMNDLSDIEIARVEGMKQSWRKWAKQQRVLPWDDLKKWKPNYSKDYRMK